MPAPKPSEDAEWADGGGAVITDPPLIKKQTGWVDNEFPPAEYFNWWMNNVFQWQAYLRDFEIQTHTWTATQIFSAEVDLNGTVKAIVPVQSLIGVAGQAGWIDAPSAAATTFQLLSVSTTNGGSVSFRRYLSYAETGSMIFTHNCSWVDSLGHWVTDFPGAPAVKWSFSPTLGLRVQSKNLPVSTWADGAWDDECRFGVTLEDVTNNIHPSMRLSPRATPTAALGNGDIWVDSTINALAAYINGSQLSLYPQVAPVAASGLYGSGWGDSTFALSVYRDNAGRVFFHGTGLGTGSPPGGTFATLPASLRPAHQVGNGVSYGMGCWYRAAGAGAILAGAFNITTGGVMQPDWTPQNGDVVILTGSNFNALI